MKFAEVPALSLRTTDLASFIDATLFDIFYLMQHSGIKCICRLNVHLMKIIEKKVITQTVLYKEIMVQKQRLWTAHTQSSPAESETAAQSASCAQGGQDDPFWRPLHFSLSVLLQLLYLTV